MLADRQTDKLTAILRSLINTAVCWTLTVACVQRVNVSKCRRICRTCPLLTIKSAWARPQHICRTVSLSVQLSKRIDVAANFRLLSSATKMTASDGCMYIADPCSHCSQLYRTRKTGRKCIVCGLPLSKWWRRSG